MKKNLNSEKFLNLNSQLWFWPFFTGAILGLGYSITKNILISRIDTKETSKQNLKRSVSSKEALDFKNTSSLEGKSRLIYKSNNQLYRSIKTNRENSLEDEKKVKKNVKIATSQNSYLTFSINVSKEKYSKKLAAFNNRLSFFKAQNIENLMKTLDPQNKLNLLK